ncbi:MAG TPA: hypothetical protein VG122_24385 [Gemmata sp.]|nr:hypothetical protein [Gemmata sp.]
MRLRTLIRAIPSVYLFDRLQALRDWVTNQFDETQRVRPRVKLNLEAIEERIVPVGGSYALNHVPLLGSGPIGSATGSDGGNPGAADISPAGVNYSDGDVELSRTDLSSSGFGTPWSQGGSWSNLPGYAPTNTNGNGWMNPQMPFLENPNSSTIIAVTSGDGAQTFTLSGSTYADADFMLNTLVHTGTTFVLTDTTGNTFVFNDFSTSVPTAERGQFVSETDPYGNTTSVYSYTSANLHAEIRRSSTIGSTTYTESYEY